MYPITAITRWGYMDENLSDVAVERLRYGSSKSFSQKSGSYQPDTVAVRSINYRRYGEQHSRVDLNPMAVQRRIGNQELPIPLAFFAFSSSPFTMRK